MTRLLALTAAIPLAALATGCCDQSVVARAFIGHKSLDECRKLLNTAEAPISIICPGTEVTVCWAASDVSQTTVTVSPDPQGLSGTKAAAGALYFKPGDSTSVNIVASDCASTVKQIQVINGPTPATFDAGWDGKCSQLTYRLDPAFIDPKVQTIDVTAAWDPIVTDGAGGAAVCPTPPFLAGAHPIEAHFFDIDKPFLTHPFSRILKATEDWNYKLKTCQGLGFKCNPAASLPFDMTLVCPAG
jgi:hypothetical protein